jgi:bifunctional non-homologous end joining protein LigD
MSEPLQPLVPMQPTLTEEPFDHPDWVYQIKWDGVRVLTYHDESGLRLVNRRLNERTANYPELHFLKEHLRARSAILDGEIIAFGADGKPSFSSILKRDLVKSADKIRLLPGRIPVYYMVFDLLHLDGKSLTGEPLLRRQELLAEVLPQAEQVKVVENHASGTALFRVMKEQGMEGIVCKEKQGTYKVGERSRTWLKVKYFRQINAVVGGVGVKNGFVNSLILGVYTEGKLICVGKAGSGLSSADVQALTQFARAVKGQPCPFEKKPKFPGANFDEIIWFPLQLVVEVEFMEWTSDLILRAPTIQRFVERDPAACQI